MAATKPGASPIPMNILIWTLSIGIALFQFVYYWTTTKILNRGGTELNPVMAKLMNLFGRQAGLIIGKLYAAVLALTGAYLGWWDNKILFTLLILLFGLYAVVVANNLRVYREQYGQSTSK